MTNPTQHIDGTADHIVRCMACPATFATVAESIGHEHMTDTQDISPDDDPITDSGGYLSCGCHGSQRDHTCTDIPEPYENDE